MAGVHVDGRTGSVAEGTYVNGFMQGQGNLHSVFASF